MRLKFTLAAALLCTSLAAHADSIINTINFAPVQGQDRTSGTSFVQFDPTFGTLNSVVLAFSSTATFSGGGSGDRNYAYYSVSFSSRGSYDFTSTSVSVDGNKSGAARIDATLPTDSFKGTGTIDTYVNVGNFSSANLYSTFSPTTVTYNYTAAAPVAVTPEPSSFAMLGTGLLGVLGMARRRFA